MKAVIIGPGRIGCGYLAPLLLQAGWEVTFTARTAETAAVINRRRRFRIRVTRGTGAVPVGDGLGPGSITQFTGFDAVALGSAGFNRAVAAADLVCSAIRTASLPELAPPLAVAIAGHRAERPLEVWVVENDYRAGTLGPSVRLAAAESGLSLPPVVFARAVAHVVVGRGTWHDAGTPEFVSDAWRTMVIERGPVTDPRYQPPGVRLADDFPARLREKLYGFNAGHAIAAYLGRLRGHATIDRAVADPSLFPIVAMCLIEARRALLNAHPGLGRDVYGAVEETLRRFRDEELADPVARVARDPIRKLGPDDRLLGPVGLIRQAKGRIPPAFVWPVVAALLYRDPADGQAVDLAGRISCHGVTKVLRTVCGLDPADPFAAAIADHYRAFVAGGKTFLPPVPREIVVPDLEVQTAG